jgi:NtrC-family two-component system sensor histidine kinase KinB
MHTRRLSTRFILAGCLLVATTVATSLWAALTFARLSEAADEALTQSRARMDLTAGLADALEREDDALLLALGGDTARASRELADQRHRGDRLFEQLAEVLSGESEGVWTAHELREDMGDYRAAGSQLLATATEMGALERYHRQVNPRLRRAVAACGRVREQTFEALRLAGVRARDDADHATRVVGLLSAAALVVALAVSTWLARSVVPPVQTLTDGVDALRRGDFNRRLQLTSQDELGRLAEGFNRLGETLAEYRASSLGELLAAKTTLEATLDALPDAVIVVAPDGSLAALNPPARAVLAARGITTASHLRDLPLQSEHREAVAAALAGNPTVPSRADFALALDATIDGAPHRFLVAAVPVPEFTPHRHGAVVVLSDVTEFARLDGLRAELIGVASHELKTPLTTLRMNLRLLGEDEANLSPRQREMLEAALGGCAELSDTIEELLDVTRIEAGQLRLDLTPADMSVVVSQAVRLLRPRFDDSGVAVRVQCDGASAVVRGDVARLRTVLVNLLTNALKYSPTGGTVTVHLASVSSAGPMGVVQLGVEDVGLGIPAEYRERVFEKFFRVEDQLNGDASGVRGTGIGLYLCREIVKAHDGTIRCEPGQNGVGTCVSFCLPVISAAN